MKTQILEELYGLLIAIFLIVVTTVLANVDKLFDTLGWC